MKKHAKPYTVERRYSGNPWEAVRHFACPVLAVLAADRLDRPHGEWKAVRVTNADTRATVYRPWYRERVRDFKRGSLIE